MSSTTPYRTFSKSKLLALRQCRKRLWLEVHQPELRDFSTAMAAFQTGYTVGDLARKIFDPTGQGRLISIEKMGWDEAFAQTKIWMKEGIGPIFEGAFATNGGLALADVMLPVWEGDRLTWDLIEIKSSTQVKNYHRDDAAIQAALIRREGWALRRVQVAVLNTSFIYPGEHQYEGIFRLTDLTEEVTAREPEVWQWIVEARETAGEPSAPDIPMGGHCHSPFDCPFIHHCRPKENLPQYPLHILPRLSSKKKQSLREKGFLEIAEVPDNQLSAQQRKVKQTTLQNKVFWDQIRARQLTQPIDPQTRFLDFETIKFSVPIWKGTRPYQQIPFQFSLHTRHADGTLLHHEFLDLSGEDPREALMQTLIQHCGTNGRIYAYHTPFESQVLHGLARDFPAYADSVKAIISRLVDLCPITRKVYYHPSQRGTWSLKAVLPAMCPDLSYQELDGVHHGGEAMEVFATAISPNTSPEERATMDRQLRAYCHLDTLAILRIWEKFTGLESNQQPLQNR